MNSTSSPYRIDRRQIVITTAAFVVSAALVGVTILVYGLTPLAFVAGIVVPLAAGGVGWLLAGESTGQRSSTRVAVEAVALRDALGAHADQLDAVSAQARGVAARARGSRAA